MSTIAETYKHSGRWSPLGVSLPLVLAAVLAIPLGMIYAYFMVWIPIIYLNVVGVAFYGFAIGFIIAKLMKVFKTRHSILSFMIGALAGFVCLYGTWIGHIFALFEDSPFVFLPTEMWEYMMILNEEGSWSLRSDTVTGVVLAIVWVIEAGILIILPALTVFADIKGTPFCEKNQVWLNKEENVDTLALFSDDDIAQLGKGDLEPFLHARPKHVNDLAWTRLVLKSSAESEDTFTMRIIAVHLSPNKEGVMQEGTTEITADLLIDKQAYAVVRRFAEMELISEPAATTQGADEAAAAPAKEMADE